jgi:DNA-binding transcriptional LysR family regulator
MLLDAGPSVQSFVTIFFISGTDSEDAPMQIAQVAGFLEVSRWRNLSRAAEALHVTQPALTARIRQLEVELGAPLFERSSRGMRLTDAGRAFLPYAERAVEALDAGRTLVGEHARGTTGRLTIGTAPAVGAYVLPGLLARYVERFASVRLVVRTGHSEEIVELVARGELDVGLIRELHHPGVTVRTLYEDELMLVVPPHHEFAGHGAIDVERLADATLILFDRTSSYYDLTNAIFRAAGVAPRSTIELDNIEAAKQMVRGGLGVALLPHTAIAGDVARGALRVIAMPGLPPTRRRIVAVRRVGAGEPAPAVRGFLDVLDRIHDVLPDRGTILA